MEDMVQISSFLNLEFRRRCAVWCAIDGLCMLVYYYYSAVGDRIPYIYEYLQLAALWGNTYSPSDWQYVALPIATALWVLSISYVVSCFLFSIKWKHVRYVVFVQLPLRLLALLVLGTATFASKTTGGKVGLGCLTVLFFILEAVRLMSVGFPKKLSILPGFLGTR